MSPTFLIYQRIWVSSIKLPKAETWDSSSISSLFKCPTFHQLYWYHYFKSKSKILNITTRISTIWSHNFFSSHVIVKERLPKKKKKKNPTFSKYMYVKSYFHMKDGELLYRLISKVPATVFNYLLINFNLSIHCYFYLFSEDNQDSSHRSTMWWRRMRPLPLSKVG